MQLSIPVSMCLVAVVCSGCGADNTLPPEMVGSYARDTLEVQLPGAGGLPAQLPATLNVTRTGLAVSSPSVEVSAGIEIEGKKILEGKQGAGLAGSALLSKVQCASDDSCTVEGSDGCTGTIDRTADDDLVLVLLGSCKQWSGKWLSQRTVQERAKARAAQSAAPIATPCPPAPACPSVPDPAGSSPVAPTERPDAAPSRPRPTSGTMACMQECASSMQGCTSRCATSDTGCVAHCNADSLTCLERCP